MTHPLSAGRILIVEDEAKTRVSLAEGLGLQGWDIVTAANGDEGEPAAPTPAAPAPVTV